MFRGIKPHNRRLGVVDEIVFMGCDPPNSLSLARVKTSDLQTLLPYPSRPKRTPTRPSRTRSGTGRTDDRQEPQGTEHVRSGLETGVEEYYKRDTYTHTGLTGKSIPVSTHISPQVGYGYTGIDFYSLS